jgi:hypothetical protein
VARKVRVELVCDACEDERPAERTLAFGFSDDAGVRRDYELELCAEHIAEFAASLAPWIAKARQESTTRRSAAAIGSRRGGGPSPTDGRRSARRDPEQLAGIRVWARANGYEVSDKGRIPAEIEEAYNRRAPAARAGSAHDAEDASGGEAIA